MRLNLVRIITADCAPSPGADIAGVHLTRCGEGRGEPSLGAGRNHRPRHRASAALSPRHSTTKTSGYGCRRPLRMSLCRSRRCVRRFRLSLHTARTCGRRRTCGWYRPSLRLVRAHPSTATGACPSHIGGETKWTRPSHICIGTGSPIPHLHRDRSRCSHICIGTGLICIGTGLGAATSTHGSSRIRLHRDHTVPHRCHICTGAAVAPWLHCYAKADAGLLRERLQPSLPLVRRILCQVPLQLSERWVWAIPVQMWPG